MQPEQIELEQRLFDLQRIESLRALSTGIAHQFNDLFTVIIGNLSLALSKKSDSEWIKEKIEAALAAAQQGARDASLLLSYVGKKKPGIILLDVKEFFQKTTLLLSSIVPGNISLNFFISSNLPAIFADHLQLQQALTNIIGNSVEAIGSKNGLIQISCKKGVLPETELTKNILAEKLAAHEYLIISIIDSGEGIASENLKRIIEPYFKTKFTGRGMGLAVAAGIIRVYHGGLIVNSTLELGTTLKIILPIAVSESIKHVKEASPNF